MAGARRWDAAGILGAPAGPGLECLALDSGFAVEWRIDGSANQALLQHPIGITWRNGLIYVADTYNNKIKRFDPKSRVITTLLGGSKAGHEDGSASQSLLNEPCGLAFAGDKLFIADTNNNLIRVFNTKTNQILINYFLKT